VLWRDAQKSLSIGAHDAPTDLHDPKGFQMNSSLRSFMHQYLGVVAATLVPVVLVAFVSIPLALGAHPGEVRQAGASVERHMT
jgi:hypothetical protein